MLEPCATCRRLVRVSHARCPFCRSDARGVAPVSPIGRHSRAALIATALAALGACTPKEAATTEKTSVEPKASDAPAALVTAYGGPMLAPTVDASAALATPDASAAPPPPPPVIDASAPKPPTPHASTSVRPPATHAPVTAYGGPPLGPMPKPTAPKP